MENNLQKLTDAELLKAAAHITVDPCDPSQDAMAKTLAELMRRYSAMLTERKHMLATIEAYAEQAIEDGHD